ncbi:hypothetical protein E2C01_090267 [Portunus trituberculatus]|uniref:Uncharacterized protein n=1 Tax=Portunus trituberculatus TaxID=210409 RepID=A0A5B7JFY5_PORTR|nr:hypothetical protein [Portunus trituberculatus]
MYCWCTITPSSHPAIQWSRCCRDGSLTSSPVPPAGIVSWVFMCHAFANDRFGVKGAPRDVWWSLLLLPSIHNISGHLGKT